MNIFASQKFEIPSYTVLYMRCQHSVTKSICALTNSYFYSCEIISVNTGNFISAANGDHW
jgi:hypothetical protein